MNAPNQVASDGEYHNVMLNKVDTISSHKYQGIHPFAHISWKCRGEGWGGGRENEKVEGQPRNDRRTILIF